MEEGNPIQQQALARLFHVFILVIDADNTSVDLFPRIMQKAEAWGTLTLRRVYGNQDTLQSSKWKAWCLQYALQPIPHVGIPGAKNATDIALTVDTMDLLWLYKEYTPNFCLVTGDQDFTALILRLRSQGSLVYCIGRTTKAEALAKVCTQFLPVEPLSQLPLLPASDLKQEQKTISTQQLAQTKLSQAKSKQTAAQAKQPQAKPKQPTTQMKQTQAKPQPLPLDPVHLTLLTHIAKEIQAKEKIEWIPLSFLGAPLKQRCPEFQVKTYGYKNLTQLLKGQSQLFEHRHKNSHLEVRLKNKGT